MKTWHFLQNILIWLENWSRLGSKSTGNECIFWFNRSYNNYMALNFLWACETMNSFLKICERVLRNAFLSRWRNSASPESQVFLEMQLCVCHLRSLSIRNLSGSFGWNFLYGFINEMGLTQIFVKISIFKIYTWRYLANGPTDINRMTLKPNDRSGK